ncbi:ras-related and estrogen-regulated growth inhibitor [Aplysia californica]|uniref:small monomeric GTPase n=1 Tax=Aplysia californica TaxID=6500 RepID=A0ABM0JLQ5_APLCA|nr:ras-related and estrogen-regulated growth inhibitor [Aplysia californica]
MNGTRLLRSPGVNDAKDGTCRIVVLGTSAVGKTALTVRFLTKRFIGEYSPTLESVYRYCTSTAEDDDIRLDILDTAGQVCTEWKESYALWADCFMFVYSITDYASYEEAQRLRRLVEATRRSTSLCCVVVGNKNDLVYDRQVTARQGQELAVEMGCNFYEVSACDWNQISEVCDLFLELHALWRKTRLARDGRQRKSSSSAKFKQAIQKVISGKGSISRRSSSNGNNL